MVVGEDVGDRFEYTATELIVRMLTDPQHRSTGPRRLHVTLVRPRRQSLSACSARAQLRGLVFQASMRKKLRAAAVHWC